jgi:hypothetical protein
MPPRASCERQKCEAPAVHQISRVPAVRAGHTEAKAGEKEMTVETPHLASLRKKLKAREGHKEYKKNCEEIRKEIARIENCQGLDL